MVEGNLGVGSPKPPGFMRRLACFTYEGVLLFGVVMVAGLLYGVVTNQRHALTGAFGLRVYLFVVLGAYFVWFWSRQGQTLAMRTWRMQLVDAQGQRPSALRSACRYVLAWMWFLPALATVQLSGLKGAGPASAAIIAGVVAYAALARFHPHRQCLHDALCGTRLVDWKPEPRPEPHPSPAKP